MAIVVQRKRRGPGRPPSNKPRKPREGALYHVWLNKRISAAFEQSREEISRTKTAHLERILEEWLKLHGFLSNSPQTKE